MYELLYQKSVYIYPIKWSFFWIRTYDDTKKKKKRIRQTFVMSRMFIS